MQMQMLVHTVAPALFFLFTAVAAPLSLPFSVSPGHFLKPVDLESTPQEFMEITHPLPPSDHVTPSCTLPIINHFVANTINQRPLILPYSPPPDCPQPWTHVILEFHAKCKGQQDDHIAGLWLDGTELLRTSTAQPSKPCSFWKVRKDITRYSSLLLQSNLKVTMMVENMANHVFASFFQVKVNLFFFKDKAVRVPSILSHQNFNAKLGFESDKYYDPPADLIIPISQVDGEKQGFWFRIESESDLHFKKIQFPGNTYRAILELYVSFHGNDEFWYSNPPNSYIKMNNLTTGHRNGCYREVFVTIDGRFIGSEVPFPVIFAGGINPLLWEPVVAIGAFSLPSYDLDLTPFLGLVLDGKEHEISIGVDDAIPYWLVNANLHIWLDHGSSKVQASSAVHPYNPNLSLESNEGFKLLDGKFKVAAKRRTVFVGWVKSSFGNLTTRSIRQFRYKNSIRFEKNGTYKMVQQRVKVRRQVEVRREEGNLVSSVFVRRRYPLEMKTWIVPGSKKNRYVVQTNVSHTFMEHCSIGIGKIQSSVSNDQVSIGIEKIRSSVFNNQVSVGYMKFKDHSMYSGGGNTQQTYSYRDEFGCYSRSVGASDGKLIHDKTLPCLASF